MSVRVRFAPSPTGFQHIGNVRTALFDLLLARSRGGRFVLRIEDTDQARYEPTALADIYATFEWLGLRWDEGPDVGGPHAPYVQSERLPAYRAAAERLLAAGHAYHCYCSAERLRGLRESGHVGYDRRCRDLSPQQRASLQANQADAVVRLRVPTDGVVAFDDEILGPIERASADVAADPVLLKSDGFPTYHLAVVVDDAAMEISHVLRGQEWISSTPIHILLYRALDLGQPRFVHLPLLNGPDGRKLGKRHGATRVAEFRDVGYLPAALLNYLALLGWSPGNDRELFSLEELAESFSLEHMSKAPAIFDHAKLDWFNGQYLRQLSAEELATQMRPYLERAEVQLGEQLVAGAALVRERLTSLGDAPQWLRFLGADVTLSAAELTPKRLAAGATAGLLRHASPLLAALYSGTTADDAAVEESLRELAVRQGAKFGDLMMALRLATTGSKVSPPLLGSLRLLGAETVARRLDAATATLSSVEEERQ